MDHKNNPHRRHSSKSLARLIQEDQNTNPDTVSTDALIQNFNALGLRRDSIGDGDVDGTGVYGEDADDNNNPFLDTTASYLAFGGGNHNYNVSETRMEIQNNQPITPLRGSISQDSIQSIPSGAYDSTNTNRRNRRSRRRSSGSINDPLESPPSPYLDLDYLQTLLLQLPNQQLYNDFKGILQNYLTILEQHHMNPALDRFIITIHNQLKSKSHIKLNKIIDIFINEPSNLAMKLSNRLYFKDQILQRQIMETWIIKRRKNHELNQSWKIWMIYLKKKYMTQWIYKHKSVEEDLVANADMFYQIRRLMKFWDIWKTLHNQQKDYTKIANYQIQSKFFNNWRDKIEINYDEADWFYQQNLIKTTISKWKLQTKSKTTTPTIKITKFFTKWHEKHLEIQSLKQDGEELQRVFHAGFFFTKWKSRSQITLNKTQELEQILNNSLKIKYFNNWQNKIYYTDLEKQVLYKRKHLLLQFALNEWKTRLNHKQMLNSFIHDSDKIIASKFINQWKRQLTLTNKIDQVGQKTRLESSMNLWKLATNKKLFERNRDSHIQNSIFENWKRKSYLSSVSKDYDLQNLQKYWDKLKNRKLEIDNAMSIGIEAYEAYSKIIYFNNWRYQLKYNNDLQIKADFFNKGVYLKKIKLRFENMKDMAFKADEFHHNKSRDSSIHKAFSTWRKSYETKLQDQLESKLKDYEALKLQNKMKSFYNNWKSQYQSYLSQEQIFKEEFQNTLILKPALNKWIQKYNDMRDMEEKANEMNNLNLISSGFTKLQLGFLRIQDLNIKSLEFEDDAQIKLILKYLNFWSLKSLKMKRDNENIQSFQRRWNRAHCRAILLLWKGKTWEKQEQQQLKLNFSQLEIDNTTDEDPSPLKTKSIFNNSSSFIGSSTETPIRSKSIFNTSRSTNHSLMDNKSTPLNANTSFNYGSQLNSGIPGSERIKRQRMEALKNHYSQIKYAIPSPLKSNVKKPIETSTIRKLNFTNDRDVIDKHDEDGDEFDEPIFEQQQPEESIIHNNDEYDDQYYLADEPIEYENPIPSPIISHKKINQNFSERFNSMNKSKPNLKLKSNRSSASDNLFRNPF